MHVEDFVSILDSDFYTGVPDSQLKALCNYLMEHYGINKNHHIIAANEGNCTALAAGYHLATGKIPVVYMQNSGEGNIINPVASLLHKEVYGIPMIFVVGWRGEPGVPDEPQHIFQGKITKNLLDTMEIRSYILEETTTLSELKTAMNNFKELLSSEKSVAFIIRKNALSYDKTPDYTNQNLLNREEVIRHIVKVSQSDSVVCTTGKASRELFEIREANKEGHQYDFLTVGSMGHASSLALGIALNRPDRKIWCIDGDGALLMHMGAMTLIGSNAPKNLIHIVLNNAAHETVGGMPTTAGTLDLTTIATGCGYPHVACVSTLEELNDELLCAKKNNELTFLEVRCSIGSRKDLGRPTVAPSQNKEHFMRWLNET